MAEGQEPAEGKKLAEDQELAEDSGGGGGGEALQQLIASQSKSSSESFVEFSELEKPEEGKNQMFLICVHCQCKVLKPGYGTLVDRELFLPSMTEKYKIGTDPSGDTLTKFWLIEDMFHFENVGFSKTVGQNVKYLICADCEKGPIGWHSIENRKEYFVSAERVKYGSA